MKENKTIREFEYLGRNYRVTTYVMFDKPGIIEIEEWEKAIYFWQKDGWKRIYMGHITPLEWSLSFFHKAIA